MAWPRGTVWLVRTVRRKSPVVYEVTTDTPLWQDRFFNDIKQPSMALLSSMNPIRLVLARISFGWIEVPKVLKHRASITKIKTNEASLIQSESGLDETDIIANDTCASSERRFTLHSISQIQHFNTGNIHYSIWRAPQKFDGPSCSLVCRSSRLVTQISSPLHRSSVLCGRWLRPSAPLAMP
jgi:hypothetical protein